MKMSRKYLSLALACMMVAAGLSGCGSSSGTSTTAAGAEGETTAAAGESGAADESTTVGENAAAEESTAAGETSAAAGETAASQGEATAPAASINIVEQNGLAYAPLEVMEKQKLIEKHYNGEVTVTWSTLNSGASITEAFASGDVQVGGMGIAPAVTGALTEGVGMKIAAAMSSQPNKIMTNDSSIQSLADIGDKKIALVNTGSIQHILLAMKAKKELGDAHALDNNITAMSHPDGMAALISGAVSLQLTTSPYVFQEEAQGMTEVDTLTDVWPEDNTFIVMCVSEKLHDDNPELYQAVLDAEAEAIDWINNNHDEAAELLCDDLGTDKDTVLGWLEEPGCGYSTTLKGVMDMADFMAEEGFLKVDPASDISDLAFEGVQGS